MCVCSSLYEGPPPKGSRGGVRGNIRRTKGKELWRDWEKVQKERMEEKMAEEAVGDVLSESQCAFSEKGPGARQTVEREVTTYGS